MEAGAEQDMEGGDGGPECGSYAGESSSLRRLQTRQRGPAAGEGQFRTFVPVRFRAPQSSSLKGFPAPDEATLLLKLRQTQTDSQTSGVNGWCHFES